MVFEEDEVGDAMYIILSGQCQIRARPAHAAAIPQHQALPVSSVVVDIRPTVSMQRSDSDSSRDEEQEKVQPAPRVVRSDAEHSASFWIHKYMQQVQALHFGHCLGKLRQQAKPLSAGTHQKQAQGYAVNEAGLPISTYHSSRTSTVLMACSSRDTC